MSETHISSLANVVANIEPLDPRHTAEARTRLDSLTKPIGSLGRLEDIATQMYSIFSGHIPIRLRRAVYVFAADHGVTAEGVSAYPREVTAQMVANFASGGAAINQLARTGGDVSGLDCLACHDKGKTLVLKVDAANHAILPKEHEDLVMRHGRNDRNDNCFNCHDPVQLDLLVTRDGRKLKLTDSTLLCGNCHGPTLRDWEAGIHGRTSGHWDRARGPIERQDCVSCHNPHSPAFPEIKPAPGPQNRRNDEPPLRRQ